VGYSNDQARPHTRQRRGRAHAAQWQRAKARGRTCRARREDRSAGGD